MVRFTSKEEFFKAVNQFKDVKRHTFCLPINRDLTHQEISEYLASRGLNVSNTCFVFTHRVPPVGDFRTLIIEVFETDK